MRQTYSDGFRRRDHERPREQRMRADRCDAERVETRRHDRSAGGKEVRCRSCRTCDDDTISGDIRDVLAADVDAEHQDIPVLAAIKVDVVEREEALVRL